MSVSTLDLARLSTYAYQPWSTGPTTLPLNGWTVVRTDNFLFGSYSATVYRKGSDVVIAFRGTDGIGDVPPDLAFGLPNPLLNPQYLAAAQTLLSTDINEGDTITLTGHSLGGGLAGLVAAEFDLPATVFAPAPYGATLIDDPEGYLTAAENVDVIRIEGEMLDYLPSIGYPANSTQKIELNNPNAGLGTAIPYHSMMLHFLMLHSESVSKSIPGLSQLVPPLIDALITSDLSAATLGDVTAPEVLYRSLIVNSDFLTEFFNAATRLGAGAAASDEDLQTGIAKLLIQVARDDLGNNQELVGGAASNLFYVDTTKIVTQGGGQAIGLEDIQNYINTIAEAEFDQIPEDLELPATPDVQVVAVQGNGDAAAEYEGKTLSDLFVGGVASDKFAGAAGDDIAVGEIGEDEFDGGAGNDFLFGGYGGDTLNGGDGDDCLFGSAGAETMTCGEGNDIAFGGVENDNISGDQGKDQLFGGEGNDTLTGGEGNDALDGGAEGDEISGDQGDDKLFGGAGDDTLVGGEGNDTLEGGGGTDQLVGGAGNEVYLINETADVVVESESGGIDIVKSSVSFVLGGNVEALFLFGTDAINGTGDGQKNLIVGNSAANTISGGEGEDILIGGAGDDVIYADDDDERDIIDGGAGADKFYISSLDIIANLDAEDIVYVDGILAGGTAVNGSLPDGFIESNGVSFARVWVEQTTQLGTYGNANRYLLEKVTGGLGVATENTTAPALILGVEWEYNVDRNQLNASSWETGSHIAQEMTVEGGQFKFIEWEGVDHHVPTLDPLPTYKLDPGVSADIPEEEVATLRNLLTQYGYDFASHSWNEQNLVNAWTSESGSSGSDQGSRTDPDAGAPSSGDAAPQTAGGAATAAAQAVSAAGGLISPLALDLDGDGLELTSLSQSKAYFDLDANGFAQRTGWVAGGDGLLAIDTNANGQIDDIDELFGAPEPYGKATTNGFDALGKLDSNVDGKIDASDAKFADLRVWIDADQDGLTDAGELKTLSEAGIESISLSATENVTQNAGNTVSHVAEFTKSGGGGTGTVADVWFANSTFETYSTETATIDATIMALPAVRGYGEIPSLRLAMSHDTISWDNQGLFQQVQELAFWRSTHDGEVPSDLLQRIEQIVLRWSGASWEDPTSRGPNIDARHLIALERFTGQDFFQSTGPEGPNPGPNAAAALDQAWSDFVLAVGARILVQSVLQPAFSSVTYVWSTDSFDGTLNPAQSVAALASLAPVGSGTDAHSFWKLAVSTLDEVAEDLAIVPVQYDQALADALLSAGFDLSLQELRDLDLQAGSGNIIAANEDVAVLGSAAADTIIAGAGNDRIDGGAGNDTLNGQAGADAYIFGKESGQDIVSDLDISAPATDTVQLAAGIAAADVLLTRSGDDLIIRIAGSTAAMTVVGQFAGADAGIERIRFASGTEWSRAYIESLLVVGTAGDDVLNGDTASNWIDGQTGADTMTGGDGSDTYVVDDEGDEVVEAASGGNDLVDSSVDYVLDDNVEGLVLSGDAVAGSGNALDNWIAGNAENNELDGGGGADLLAGGLGDDSYVVDSAGDVIVEHSDEGVDTVISSIDWALAANIENLTLAGSDNLNAVGNALDNVIAGNDGQNTVSGELGNDALDGGAANDTLYGGEGNDTLTGGAGADTMSGGVGQDIYWVDDADDLVIEEYRKGIDVVNASIDYVLGADIEDLVLTDAAVIGTGNALHNAVTGSEADNILSGEAGNDTVDGGLGNDTIAGGTGNDALNGDDGADLVQGGAGNDAIGGGNGNDLLAGGDGNDNLSGGSGNDELDGGVGADALAGGSGNDTYIVDDAGDVISESSGQGTADLAQSSISYTLTANVERLTLIGTSDIDGTGNSLANLITGNDGANVLDGSTGNDTVDGGAGNDLVKGADGNDTLSGQSGIDTLQGGNGNDVLAWDADDILDGGANRDTLLHTGTGAIDVDTAKLSNIEVVNLGAGDDNDNGIILSIQDVLDLAASSSGSGFSKNGDVIDLLIYGDNATATRDNVELGGAWTTAGTFSTSALTGSTITFNIYQASGTQVAVQQGLDLTIV